MRKIEYIVIHHTASPRETTVEDIRTWHKKRGFSDIGYHFVIDGEGIVRKGRDLSKIGAHVKGLNWRAIGIAVTGDNTVPGMEWTEFQVDVLRTMIQAMRILFPDAKVVGHRDLRPTECPGVDVGGTLTGPPV